MNRETHPTRTFSLLPRSGNRRIALWVSSAGGVLQSLRSAHPLSAVRQRGDTSARARASLG